MLIFGLTGGSGSGKTSVASMLIKLGIDVIDTDMIARKITEKNSPCLTELTGFFGKDIINNDGTLKRQTLASIAFSNSKYTQTLNRITHKYIKQRVLYDIGKVKSGIAAVDGAVIIGSNIEPICDFIVSVIADTEVRINRIMKRDGLTEIQARERINAQPGEEFYKKHSKFVLINNGTVEELEQAVLSLYNKLKEV